MSAQLKVSLEANGFWMRKIRQRSQPAAQVGAPLRVADLFSGCGGLTLGAVWAAEELGRAVQVELAVDNWQLAVDTYRKNFSRIAKRVVCADVSSSLRELAGTKVDVVVAGPPCQGHSDLNNSTRRFDSRNELYLAPVEFSIESDAPLVVIENVPTVVHSSQNVVHRAIKRLIGAGYVTSQSVVDVSKLGIPQRRRRHILVGSRMHDAKELDDALADMRLRDQSPTVFEFISDLQDVPSGVPSRMSAENQARIQYLFAHDLYDLPNSERPACHRNKDHSYRSMYGRIHPDKPAQTITSGFGSMGQGRFVHPTRPRLISIREAARIQGFPDWFDFNESGRLSGAREMIANAVPPAVTTSLLTRLLRDGN